VWYGDVGCGLLRFLVLVQARQKGGGKTTVRVNTPEQLQPSESLVAPAWILTLIRRRSGSPEVLESVTETTPNVRSPWRCMEA